MFDVDIEDLIGIDQGVLTDRLQVSQNRIQIRVFVDSLYQASSKCELADNWLKIWYLGERLAECAGSATVYYRQVDDRGKGLVVFNFKSIHPERMTSALEDLIPAFDPDEDEAAVFIYDEAHDWFQNRPGHQAQLPDLEEDFRRDAREAAEFEGYEVEWMNLTEEDDKGGE